VPASAQVWVRGLVLLPVPGSVLLSEQLLVLLSVSPVPGSVLLSEQLLLLLSRSMSLMMQVWVREWQELALLSVQVSGQVQHSQSPPWKHRLRPPLRRSHREEHRPPWP